MADLQLLPIVQGPRGNKSAGISRKNGPATFKAPVSTTTPFNAGVYGGEPGATRLNLDLNCGHDAYHNFLTELDEFIIKTLSADPQTYFKKKLSPEDVRAMFKPSITQRERDGQHYEPTFRTKLNIAGSAVTRCWDENKTLRKIPEDWRRCEILPIIQAKSVWFMSGNCGITFDVLDCILTEKSDECPF